MQVLVNSDNHIDTSSSQASGIREHVQHKLQRFEDHLTRIELHLSDENGHKGGSQDKRCQIEARPKGRDPVSVSHQAETLNQAIEGAMDKLGTVLERTVARTRVH